MGLSLGKTRGRGPAPPWPDLPQDVAVLILRWLPSYADRLSFGAVCHDWRLAAKQPRPPAAMPWVSLGNGSYQSIASYRFAAPGKFHRLSFGSWLLYEHSGRLFLRDHLSTATSAIEVPCRYHDCADGCDAVGHDRSEARLLMAGIGMARISMRKIVVCTPHLLAAILCTGETRTPYSFTFLRPGGRSWSLLRATDYRDIAFHRGQIFALSSREELIVHELTQPCRAKSVIQKRPAMATTTGRMNHHLVVSADKTKLLMVRSSGLGGDGIHHTSIKLQVFEADLEKREWSEVKDLGDQVIFISNTCSRAIGSSSIVDSRFRVGSRVFLSGIGSHHHWSRTWHCRCCFCDKIIKCIPYYSVYDLTSGTLSVVSLSRTRLTEDPTTEWFLSVLKTQELNLTSVYMKMSNDRCYNETSIG